MFSAYCDFCTLMHESVNTFVGHMCPIRAGNMCPTYCKSNAKLSKSDAYTAHLTTSLLFSCLISFGRCLLYCGVYVDDVDDITGEIVKDWIQCTDDECRVCSHVDC